ncbi:MAG: hypothetical protein JW768_07515 [Chitinispirillaceae bacterium]|nr:hypothetical protein [Chitinispirillaceae bacterium]
MFLLHFYRLYCSLVAGAAVYFLLYQKLWLFFVTVVVFRIIWFIIEGRISAMRINKAFDEHQGFFKEQYGPYGIRLINKAETDKTVKLSLAEVFTPNMKKLQDTVRSLEAMDVIFNAGMRPDGDAWQLHDLKLKYGRYRLEKAGIVTQEKPAEKS